MDKQYKHFMEQQNISAEVDKAFYQKLEETEHRRKPIHWKALVAAACIVLLIPVTVIAAEYFFDKPTVKLGKLDWHDSPNGYSIRFESVDSFPLDTFPDELQTLSEHKFVPYDSWEEAEEGLGIDLLNNTFLSQTNHLRMSYDDTQRAHCWILYSQHKEQLFLVATRATYRYDQLQLDLKATLTVEHPEMDEETKQVLLGMEGAITKPTNAEISYEDYTTEQGIPAVILRRAFSNTVWYSAHFAVNNISYELRAWSCPEKEADDKQIFFQALNSFELS